jgi:hypothetical protein
VLDHSSLHRYYQCTGDGVQAVSEAGLLQGNEVEIQNQISPFAPYWFCWRGVDEGVLTEG